MFSLGLLGRYRITRNWYKAYPEHKACPMMFLHMMLLMKFPLLPTGVLFMSTSFGVLWSVQALPELTGTRASDDELRKKIYNKLKTYSIVTVTMVRFSSPLVSIHMLRYTCSDVCDIVGMTCS
jgi:hypothetical protein|uniref:Uncharacterized protein n=1 Tax=Zea mays TaxID=4577 RepID=A0A804NEE2_MAIZE